MTFSERLVSFRASEQHCEHCQYHGSYFDRDHADVDVRQTMDGRGRVAAGQRGGSFPAGIGFFIYHKCRRYFGVTTSFTSELETSPAVTTGELFL
jgi:hypothetical protein